MNATTEQIERAKAMQARCPHLSLERLIEMEVKKDMRNAPKQMTKKDYEKQAIRNSTATPSKSHYEMLQEGIKKNKPSSLR